MQDQRNIVLIIVAICLILLRCSSVSAQKVPSDITVLARFEKLIDDGKFAEVETDLFRFVVAEPSNARGFGLLAKLRLRQNRLSEARSLAAKAITIDPKLVSAKLTLALANYYLGDIEQAKATLNSIGSNEITDNAIRSSVSEAQALLGDCGLALRTSDQLPTAIKNTQALAMRAGCYIDLGDKAGFASTVTAARSLLKQDPQLLVKYAEVLSKRGAHQAVVELLRPLVVSRPQNADAFLLLAKAEVFLKQFELAETHISRAEKLDPTSAKILFVKAVLKSQRGNESESLELLEKAIAADPGDLEIKAQYVVTAMRSNQPGKAVRAAESLTERQPGNLEYLYLLGAASLQNNSLDKADAALSKYFTLRPNDGRGCLALGLVYAATPERLNEARDQLQRCLTIDPNDAESAYQLGLSYQTQGETAKAIEYFERTVKLAPNRASALRDLGAAYMQTGSEAKARPVLEKAVLLAPNDADTHFQLSRLYNLIGERELAKKELQVFQKLKAPKKDGM